MRGVQAVPALLMALHVFNGPVKRPDGSQEDSRYCNWRLSPCIAGDFRPSSVSAIVNQLKEAMGRAIPLQQVLVSVGALSRGF